MALSSDGVYLAVSEVPIPTLEVRRYSASYMQYQLRGVLSVLSYRFMQLQRTVYIYKLLGNYTLVRNLTDELGDFQRFHMPLSISGDGSTGI